MKPLPIALSLPHAGLDTPPEVRHLSLLSPEDIQKDGDEGSRDMAMRLCPYVGDFSEATVARAFVDLNRKEGDLSRDGIVKTHTCWDVPIYNKPLPPGVIDTLITTWHRPYHARLSQFARQPALRLALDLHTMAEKAPPISEDAGTRRPRLCLGNAHHSASPKAWIETLAELAARYVDPEVHINTPFSGGWITRCHGREMPWIQVEVSREPWVSWEEKGEAILELMQRFAEVIHL
ncbi:hypothetical protein DSLASN_07500 [Desulfoluna limicola]|uniref:N-formylglutamate amidohydrolase n=1 Tax=Desulfoluna limicola TaxID=2810562 RepID=A0ABM7PD96_9BACT|nr:N-formylglutamate amidohydrolase [Desulfoluna limicola]BCS95118.1 hypothetical protein DSLASN_07500 [Desulfoluna limicola]